MLTIIILTKNEAERLHLCLEAIPPKYPVIVVDSGSDDTTVAIAKEHGCTVHTQAWLGFAGQRNFALKNCNIEKGWVLFVDADEFYPLEFFTWFESRPAVLESIDVLMAPSYLVFCGKRLSHAPGYPIFHPRLVRAGIAPFNIGHAGHSETVAPELRVGYGDIPYDHHFFNGELGAWMFKHIRLAHLEAVAAPFSGVLTVRARLSLLMGQGFLRAPGRFVYHYLVKGGIRDGWRGFLYSLMYAWYELTKYLLVQFKKRDQINEI
jgi:glycosyltransferase involved in cell wall biosynthesis